MSEYQMYPTKIECYDKEAELNVFSIQAIDESCATIEISIPCNVAQWDKISPMIRQALIDMKFEGDSNGTS